MIKRLTLALTLVFSPSISAVSFSMPSLQLPEAIKKRNVKELAGFALHHLVADGIFVYRGIEGLYASLMPGRYFDNNAEKYGIIGKVTGEIKEEIDAVLQEMGVNPDGVQLYAINPDRAEILLGEATYMPAIAMGNVLLIDPKFYNFIPQDERRAIIGHEAMHIKSHDLLKASLISLAIPVITHLAVNQYNKYTQMGFDALGIQNAGVGKVLHKVFGAHQYLLSTAPSKLMLSGSIFGWYQRMREKKADVGSVRTLGCAHESAQVCERLRDMNMEMRSQQTPQNALMALLIDENGENLLDSMHPELAERLRYFEAIAKEEN